MESAGKRVAFQDRLQSITDERKQVRQQAEFVIHGENYFKKLLEQINRLDNILDNMEKKGESPSSPNIIFWSSIRDSLVAAAFFDDALNAERRSRDLAEMQLDVAMQRIRHLEEQLSKFQAAEILELSSVMGSYEKLIKTKIKNLNRIGS